MGIWKSKLPEHIHREFSLYLLWGHEAGWTRGSCGIGPEGSVPCWESKVKNINHWSVPNKPPRAQNWNRESRNQMPDSRLIKQSRARMPKSKHRWIMTISTCTQNWTPSSGGYPRAKMRQVFWSRSRVNYYYGCSGCQHSYQQRQLRASPERVARIKTADAHLILDIWSEVELLQVAKANDFYFVSSAWGTAYIQKIASKRPWFPGSVGSKRNWQKKKNETLKVQ